MAGHAPDPFYEHYYTTYTVLHILAKCMLYPLDVGVVFRLACLTVSPRSAVASAGPPNTTLSGPYKLCDETLNTSRDRPEDITVAIDLVVDFTTHNN